MHGVALRGLTALVGLALGGVALAAQDGGRGGEARIAPSPECMDARTVVKIRQSGPAQIDIATAGNRFHRLLTRGDCPDVDRAVQADVLAAQGWVCNDRQAVIRHDGQTCEVVAVHDIDARTFAMSERARMDGTTTLDPVTVRGMPSPGFSRSPYTCFSPHFMQSWSEDPEGITVQVSRRHPGDFRRYRVKFVSCPGLDMYQGEIGFRSGLGIGVICGHPGDAVVPVFTPETPLMIEGNPRSNRSHLMSPPAGCPVYEVYPVE